MDCPADSCFEYIYQHEPYLRDPVAYPKVQVSGVEMGLEPPPHCWGRGDPLRVLPQMLIYMFYVLPFFCLCIYGLVVPGCSWLPDWSLVFAGAVAQVRAAPSSFPRLRGWEGGHTVRPPGWVLVPSKRGAGVGGGTRGQIRTCGCMWSSSHRRCPIIILASVDLSGAGD